MLPESSLANLDYGAMLLEAFASLPAFAPGTREKPARSLDGARELVRREIAGGMASDVVVQFAPGNYFTKATTTFDERDSGRDGHMVIYRGAPGWKSRIYGGTPVTGWRDAGDGWYRTPVEPG